MLLVVNNNRYVHKYVPVLNIDDSWLTRDIYIPLNDTRVTTLNMTLVMTPITLGWWRLMHQMEHAFGVMAQVMGDDSTNGGGGEMGSETEQIKQLFAGTNPYLLAVTMIVSVIHLVLDFLAFKNDIQFWRQQKTFVGISARSLLLNFVTSSIIFLYLVDNDASKLVLVSSASNLAITAWKLIKILR
jgi:hypothetical protein